VTDRLQRQVSRRGPVLCYYSGLSQRPGYRWSRNEYGWLLTFGGYGHYFAIGWMNR
jgi:hypothetical protein